MTSLHLTFMSGPRDGEGVVVDAAGSPPTLTMGRKVVDGLSLPYDPEVSRSHARLVWREGAWWLEDAGSSNGTFLGEFAAAVKITQPAKLEAGQILRIGLTRLRLDAAAPETQSAAGVAKAVEQS